MINSPIRLTLINVTITLMALGCGRQEEIRKYDVPKRGSVNAKNVDHTRQRFRDLTKEEDGPDAIYGVIVPLMSHMWVAELSGPRERLAKFTGEFLDFVEALDIVDTPEVLRSLKSSGSFPPGTTVAGWKPTDRPGAEFAFSLEGEEDPPVLTMEFVPVQDRFPSSMIMTSFVNDWRRRLSLDPILPDKLPDQAASFYPNGVTVQAFHVVGKSVPVEERSAGLPSGHPPIGSGGATPPAVGPHGEQATDAPPSPIDFVVPEGWKPGQRIVSRGGITVARAAAFVVTEGDAKVEITATILPPFAAALRQNVDRWRGQVGLGKTTDQQLKKDVQEIPVGEVTGQYVEAIAPEDVAPRTVIFAAVATHGGKAWIFTLKGDFDLAERQRESYLAFLKSIQFKKT